MTRIDFTFTEVSVSSYFDQEIKKEQPMRDYKILSHTRWDCKYHIVFIPKKRRKIIFGELRKYLGGIFHELAHMI